jgi:hypothetical protein
MPARAASSASDRHESDDRASEAKIQHFARYVQQMNELIFARPVIVGDLLMDERRVLLELLADLSPEAWERSTECPAWSVRGIALHLLDLSQAEQSLGTARRRTRRANRLLGPEFGKRSTAVQSRTPEGRCRRRRRAAGERRARIGDPRWSWRIFWVWGTATRLDGHRLPTTGTSEETAHGAYE